MAINISSPRDNLVPEDEQPSAIFQFLYFNMYDKMFDELDHQSTIQEEFKSITPETMVPGMFLGKEKNFRLERLLGAGTMGLVWLAEEIEGGAELRKVVCKVLPALVQGEKGELEKVLKTFRLVQPLGHPNICPIYGLKSDPACGYFFVMAYADGGTLWDWFRSQPNWQNGLPVTRVVEILRPVAQALDHAHEMGVIHRDVKPQNILFATRGGRQIPWLVDFGISAQIHHTATQTLGKQSRSGTPAYMAPEQCLPNRAQDGRVDQYALGVLAYLLLSGHLPFDAEDPVALWGQIVYTQAPPLTNVPAAINNVLQRALAKERDARFASCVEFIDALMNHDENPVVISQPLMRLAEEDLWDLTELVEEPKTRLTQNEPKRYMNITVPMDASLEEAYEKIQNGGIITILPGKYTISTTLEVNRPVTFRGNTGRAEDVIIDCPASHAFRISGGSPLFQKITVLSEAEDCGGFYMTGGTPKLFRCVITSLNGTGLYVEGEKANPQVDSCVIKNCAGRGLFVGDSARGEFRDCEFYGNFRAGIEVQTSGNPTVNSCKIHDGKACGVLVWEKGLGEFNDCEIYGNKHAGFEVKTPVIPIVSRCDIHDGESFGIWIYEKGLGLFKDCEIYGNQKAGVYVQTAGNPTVIDCKIHDGKQSGVTVLDGGLGVFRECEIYGNIYAEIQVKSSGNPTVTGCKIHHGKCYGVLVYDGGMGTFNNNSLIKDCWKIHSNAGAVKGSGNSPEIPSPIWRKIFG